MAAGANAQSIFLPHAICGQVAVEVQVCRMWQNRIAGQKHEGRQVCEIAAKAKFRKRVTNLRWLENGLGQLGSKNLNGER